ncbi:MAG TPA: MYXO-CTERM sorting domain-containing protein [Polyangium sp.]|nr:MYXO-CTERM sorting domain-containing protein [Polyangium sp.]
MKSHRSTRFRCAYSQSLGAPPGSATSVGCQASGAPATGTPIAALVIAAGLLVRRRAPSRRRDASFSRA